MISWLLFVAVVVLVTLVLGERTLNAATSLIEKCKPVTAGIYMYVAPWEADENRYHPTRRDRSATLVSKKFWTVAAARKWAEAKHLKYLGGEPCDTVTTVAFVQYGDWEDLFPAVPYWAFPENFGTNDSVWKDEESPYATAWTL